MTATLKTTIVQEPSSATANLTLGTSGQVQIGAALGAGGANYGTSGQVLTSGGSGSAPSWAPPVSMTLLGTLTTTSGTTQVLSSLTLTSYKYLYISMVDVSCTAARALLLETQTITPATSNASNSINGFIIIDLGSGLIHAVSTQRSNDFLALIGAVATANWGDYLARAGISTATTSLTFAWNGAGTFDNGSISIYGVL